MPPSLFRRAVSKHSSTYEDLNDKYTPVPQLWRDQNGASAGNKEMCAINQGTRPDDRFGYEIVVPRAKVGERFAPSHEPSLHPV